MIRLKTAAIMASIMVTTTVTACAGDLTAVRVSDYDGASRIVFDIELNYLYPGLSHITQTKIRLP